MTTRMRVPATPLSPPAENADRAMAGQAFDRSHCPVDHAVQGLAPDYLSAAPTDSTLLADGTMNYEGFFRHQLHDLHMEGNYRVFCDLERRAGKFPRATHFDDRGQSTVTVWCSNDYLGMGQHPSIHIARKILEWPSGEALIIGWLLQTKALAMIIFVNILLDKGLITSEAFTALLLMAVASTMLTIPVV
jgi:hypothetical protein